MLLHCVRIWTTGILFCVKLASNQKPLRSLKTNRNNPSFQSMKKLLVLIAATVGMFVCGAHGQQISIQFLKGSDGTAVSGLAGVVPADHWNAILSSTSNAPLVDNTGATTTGTLSVNYGNYFTGNTFPDGSSDALLPAGALNIAAGAARTASRSRGFHT